MKNNVISIVVDSVIADYVGRKACHVSPTPFVDSLVKESVVAKRMYSPGPFTDTATRSLFTGRDCLDDYSFYFKYSASPTNHYKVFKENGYETLGIFYPYYITGKNVTDYIDQVYYASGFVFTSEWFGQYSYYEEKAKNHTLSDTDILLLSKRLRLTFDVWIKFYKDILNEKECRYMIERCIGGFDIQNALSILEDESAKFNAAKEEYIYDFLSKGKSHVLATLDGINVEGYIDRDFLKEKVYNKHSKEFKYFSKQNTRANWWHNRPRLKQIFHAIKQLAKTKNIDGFICLANYYLCLKSFERMQKLSMSPNWQYEQSSYRHFETAKRAIENRKTDKPFYLSVHVEEPHNYLACFTYDTQDEKIIDEDFSVLRDYVKQLDGKFIGDLSYILSIRYVDHYIEKFCNYLKEHNLWDKTTLLICADHGSSYSFHPLHNKHVNCFDEECYHIPMIIRYPGMKGVEVDSYCNSKDILPTLLDVVGLPQAPNFRGHSIINNYEEKDYVIIEYPGGGCPDVISKKLWLGIRDSDYFVGYKIGIDEKFEDVNPDTVYDLRKDPSGFYNIADKIEISQLEYLTIHLKDYFEEVKVRTNDFINKLRNNEINI